MRPSGTAMAAKTGSRIRMSMTPLIIFAHLLVIAVTILILVWLLSFREGIAFESRSKEKIFNLHPLLMAIGFVLVAGEALMTYKTVPAERGRERFHLILHCVALVAGTIGIYAAFKFQNELSMPNMNTFHSWIGMSTFCLFGSQFLLAVYSFMFRGADSRARSRTTKRRMFFSVVIFLMAIISAETGLAERLAFFGLPHNQKNMLMGFIGLFILLSGAAVIVRTRSRMVQALVCIVIFLSAILSAEYEKITPLTLRHRQEAEMINDIGILILLYGVAVCLALILQGRQ